MIVQASAADRTITTQVTTPVKTSDASSGPGNITINTATGSTTPGSVVVSTQGAAVTIDSNNSVLNDGTISNTAASGAIGVNLLGGFSGSLTSNGNINVNGTGSNNIGILLSGSGSFVGSITTGPNAGIGVTGSDGVAIRLDAPLTGNVELNAGLAGIAAIGANSSAVLVRAPITGQFSNFGVLAASGALPNNFSNADLDPQSGWGLAIGASISGGLVNQGPAADGDSTNAAAISAVGSKPTLFISPSIGATPAPIEIGPTDTGYSIVNRGTLDANGNDPGVSATAVRIEGAGSNTTTLGGGFYTRGLVRSFATSSNLTANTQPAAAADATAISLGDGSIVNGLSNEGSILATTTGTKGGTAAGIQIDQGASLPTLTNSGTITGTAVTTDDTITNLAAYGVRDLSGTLTTIVNSGTISALGTSTDAGTPILALDLSLTTADITFTNSGTVTGQIKFGQGTNTFAINGEKALVSGRIAATGSGTLDLNLLAGSLRSDETRARNLVVGSAGITEFALNRDSEAAPLIIATGTAAFAAGAKVILTPTSFLPASGNYTLLSAAGGITFADGVGAATSSQPIPFLFTGNFQLANNDRDLQLSLQRKAPEEVGLSGNLAIIYEPSTDAAVLGNDAFGTALLRLQNEEQVAATFATLLPPTTDGIRALTIAATDQATGPIGVRQRAMVTTPRQGLGFWTQEFYSDLNAGTTAESPSYFASGMGLALGSEWGDTSNARLGLGYTYYAAQATERHPRSSKADVGYHMFSLYGGWRWQDFFITPQVNGGVGFFTSRRFVQGGGFERTVTADWTSYLASGGVMVGYVLDLGSVQIIPQVGIDGLYMYQASYTESGGGAGVDLNLGAQETKSARLFAGVVGQSAFVWLGGRVQPQILAGFSQELMNDPHIIDATFEALPGSPFAVIGPTRDPSKMIGGASFAYIFDNWTAGVNYDASHQSGAFQQSATVNITSRF
jgi:uncharacterized protein with beta-barrel porin domain